MLTFRAITEDVLVAARAYEELYGASAEPPGGTVTLPTAPRMPES